MTSASASSACASSGRPPSRKAVADSCRRLRSRRSTATSSDEPSFSAFWSSESTRRSAPTRSLSPAFMAVLRSCFTLSTSVIYLSGYAVAVASRRPSADDVHPHLRGQRRERASHRVRMPAVLLGRLLGDERAADRRGARDPQRLGRPPPRRRPDDDERRRAVVAAGGGIRPRPA